MLKLREEEIRVLCFIDDNTNVNSQIYLDTGSSIRFTEIKNILNLHQQKLTRILKKLKDNKLIVKSIYPKHLATLTKQELKNLERHTGAKIDRAKIEYSNKFYYWLTSKGEKLSAKKRKISWV